MSYKFQTIDDMMAATYSRFGADMLQKIDAPVISTTTGVYNAVYGALVWSQLNQEANTFAFLQKYPWLKAGWRIMTVRAAASGGGVAENAALPDTIKPTFAEVSTKPKEVVHNFNSSWRQEFLAKSGDDAFGALDQLRPLLGNHHREMINIMLNTDFNTLASNDVESIDRVCSSAQEETDLSYTAGDQDMYGIDRSSSTIYDAYVSEADGNDRAVTDAAIRTDFANIRINGGQTSVIQVKDDAYAAIQGAFESAVHVIPGLGQGVVSIGVNGVQTHNGIQAGQHVATVYGIPLVVSKDSQADTIGRIYYLDTTDPEGYGEPRLGLKVAVPTMYFEGGMNVGDPFGVDKLNSEGMFATMLELICTNFKAQGKRRDLK